YKNNQNIHFVFEINDIPYFKLADILITDISSRSLNFMLTGKPVVITGIPKVYFDSPVNSERMEAILKGSFYAKNLNELSSVIDGCLGKKDGKEALRKEVASHVFSHQSSAAKEYVKLIAGIIE
ncbi:MAG: CDP-glycerol glycerophosphotransferase family protein, partial [Nitrospinae bacterium]|nr:CDP-glycerol glycerophosphotransferase family protein [Nitrospinota bacterium]